MDFKQLGPYQLGKKIGQGGMGAVYAGVDSESGQAAAIKVLAPALAAEEGFRVRFESEIESLKKLEHPNIVRLYGYGEQAGTLFYAMELVPGTSLEDEIRAGRRFDWREVTQIAIRLCRALKHAHDHGVIHRDLKPANLLLTPEGEIKLSDFGIARLFGNTHLTSDGGVIGTAEYMAPEQADGRTVTDRCDQYSLGGVLYALLAGRPPFRAKSLLEMLQLQRYGEPEPITRFAPQTPAELARIIHQLLDKEPQKRFANALILSRSLEAMERGLSMVGATGDDFVLSTPDAPSPGTASISATAPTMTPTDLAGGPLSAKTDVPDLNVTEATMAFIPDVAKRPSEPTPPAARDTTAERFIKVEPKRRERKSETREALESLLSPQTLGLAVGLILIVLAGWYFMRAPSADALYASIEQATASGDADGLREATPQIKDFLERFPDDPRGEDLQELLDDVREAGPVKGAFIEAKRYSAIDPDLALSKYQALIDVYGDDPSAPEAARNYIKRARVESKRLKKRIDQYVVEARKLVQARLTRAAEIAPEDPAAAKRIYQGVVELYGEKPWAAELTQQAEAALVATPESRASAK